MLVAGLVYMKTASFGFVNWDDDENIRTNIRYKELSYDNMKYHFQHSRYKAIAIWSFMADAKIFGKNAGGYHIHNILLHVINILLVFILIKRITQKDTIALITAGLFALHPAFVEPVAWVTGRKDMLFVLFSLLSILSYLQYLKNNRKIKILWLFAIIILVYLASLAKIQAVTLPVIMLFFDWYYKRKITAEMVLEKLLLFFMIFDKWNIFYMMIFFFTSIILYRYICQTLSNKSFLHGKLPRVIFWYLVIITFFISVFFLRIFDDYKINVVWVMVISLSIYAILCFYAIRNRTRLMKKFSGLEHKFQIIIIIIPAIFFLFEMFFKVAIKPGFSNLTNFQLWSIHPGSENYYSFWERMILAPNALLYYIFHYFLISPQDPMAPYPELSIGGALPSSMMTTGIIVYIVFIVVAFLLIKYFKKNRVVILGCLWFLASISVVLHFIPIEGRVLAADRYAYPSYIGLFMIFGVAVDFFSTKFKKIYLTGGILVVLLILCTKTFIDLDTWKNSKALWERALRVNPQNHYAMYSLSLPCFTEEKNPEKALKYLDQAITLKEDFQYFNNRGRIRYAVGNTDGALQDINKSIELDSNSYAAYNNRGAIKQQLMDFKSALVDYNKAIALNSRFDDAINNRRKVVHLIFLDSLLNNNLSIPLEMQGDVAGYIEKASQIYINKKDFEKASFYLSKGISLFPDDVSFHEKLAVMYQLNKEQGKAMEAYNRGLFYLPLDPTLLLGRGILFLELGDTVKACDDFTVSATKGNPDAGNLSMQLCGE